MPERCLSRQAGIVRCCLRKKEPHMGRTSTKENKTSYQLIREELGLTR